MEAERTRRRIRAARVIAGLTVEELADRINVEGLGAGTLGNIERGERTVRRMELREIADAVDLPVAFFEVEDFSGLADGRRQSDDVLHELAESIAGMVERRDEVDDRLERLETAVDNVFNLIRKDVVPMIGGADAGSTPDASAPDASAPARRTRATRSRPGGAR